MKFLQRCSWRIQPSGVHHPATLLYVAELLNVFFWDPFQPHSPYALFLLSFPLLEVFQSAFKHLLFLPSPASPWFNCRNGDLCHSTFWIHFHLLYVSNFYQVILFQQLQLCAFRDTRFQARLSKSQKASVAFVMSVRPYAFPHVSARIPVDGFLWNLIQSTSRKSVEKLQTLLQSEKNIRYFTWRPKNIYFLDSSNKYFLSRKPSTRKQLWHCQGKTVR